MNIAFLVIDAYDHERLGIMHLSSMAKQQGHKTRLIVKGDRTFEVLLAEIRRDPPDMICFGCVTEEHRLLISLNQRLKEHVKYFSVWGGPYATYSPSELIRLPGVDALCIGEGEMAFAELLERMEQGRDYFNVKNFWFQKNGGIVRNEVRSLIENLDELPFADRELIYEPMEHLRNQHCKIFMSTRGCPCHCTYCFNHAYNQLYSGKGKVVRHNSVDYLIRDIRAVRERYPLELVLMFDDDFFLKPLPWIEEFVERFPKEVGLPFGANVRANSANEHLIALMKRAGLYSAFVGVESGDEDVSGKILARGLTNKQILRACRILKDHSIKVMTLNILGHPVPDPVEVDLKTLDLNIAIRPTLAGATILHLNPGTKLAHYAAAHGFLSPKWEEEISIEKKNSSLLRYPNARMGPQVERLHRLFGLVVQFPFLRRWVRFLIRLPLQRLYLFLYMAWHGYRYEFHMLSTGNGLRKLHKYLSLYFRYVFGARAGRGKKDE
ncbi:MAG: radical SAM protein [Candidatus Omnitrophota bacterium]